MKKPTGQCETKEQRILRKAEYYSGLADKHGAKPVLVLLMTIIDILSDRKVQP